MSSIEDRLRAEGLRPGDPAPDLDTALSAAVADGRPHRTVWLLAAAAVVIALGVGGALVLRPDPAPSPQRAGGGSSSTSSVPSGVPSAAPGHRIVFTADVGFTGAQLDEHDPTLLLVYVWPPQSGACGVYDPTPIVEEQTATTVVVRVGGSQELGPDDHRYDCTPESARVAVPVRLLQPLGDRRLVDALDHHEQVVLDPRTVAAPAVLPPGFTGGAVDLNFYENKPVTRRTYTDAGRDLRLEVMAVPRSYVQVGSGEVVGRVDGHDAHLTHDPECLWWDTGSARAVMICVGPTTSSEGVEPPPLPASQLLEVARSLR